MLSQLIKLETRADGKLELKVLIKGDTSATDTLYISRVIQDSEKTSLKTLLQGLIDSLG